MKMKMKEQEEHNIILIKQVKSDRQYNFIK